MSSPSLSVIVYPHASEIGGSQINAVELASAVRDLGHEVAVYAEDGPLLDLVAARGLRHLPRHPAPRRPSPARAHDLALVAERLRADVLHGYEWPPILEGWLAAGRSGRRVAVGTVMSMSVAPFLPDGLPLVVGTRRIRASVGPRRGPVTAIEPPVDTHHDRPGVGRDDFAARWPAPPGARRVVIVSRLARELKLEGILTAIDAVRRLRATGPVHLTIVGDGPAADVVAAAAARANAGLPESVVTLTGQLADPRGAYASADVVIGMGGSALRALAFAKPLVVQGEGGFFETLTEDTLPRFLDEGFYGLADRDAAAAVDELAARLHRLLVSPGTRERLGRWGRDLVERRFSLEAAATAQLKIYQDALAAPVPRADWYGASLTSLRGLARYKVGRRWNRLRGEESRDDFNARPA